MAKRCVVKPERTSERLKQQAPTRQCHYRWKSLRNRSPVHPLPVRQLALRGQRFSALQLPLHRS